MRSFVFGLLCGALVAAIATAIAMQLTLAEPPSRGASSTPVTVAPVQSKTTIDETDVARGLQGANDAALAAALDGAVFDRSESGWVTVKAVGHELKARSVIKGVDPLTGLAEQAVIGPRAKPVPLLALEQEVARRQLVLDLRSRDNAATRLLDHASDEESVRKLVELWEAEGRPAEFERTREDAALVLAFGATDRGREVLVRPLHEGPRERAEIAARALGQSDDERAFAILADLLANDRDPEVRRMAAAGLAVSSGLARGLADPIAALAHAARQDAEPFVRGVAVGALGACDLARAPQARTALVETIGSPSDPEPLRLAAIAAVRVARARTRSTPPEVVDALVQALNTEHDGPVRQAIATALGECAPPARLADLETALGSAQDPTVREALAKAIASVKARGEP